jgi:FtsZ-interacting cell division protein YlmF
MASLWQKTLFYLGLVDDEQIEAAEEMASVPESAQSQVRTLGTPPIGSRGAGRSVARPAAEAPTRPSRGGIAGRRVEPPESSRMRVSSNPSLAEAGVYVHRGPDRVAATDPTSEVIEARTFQDAQSVADHIRRDRCVVLDLRSTEPSMVRRLVDFSTGLTYALDGRMAKIGRGVILITPHGVSLSAGERERLTRLGLYQQKASG